jgi:ribosomal protein S18 acetylase RimI-like enzyme
MPLAIETWRIGCYRRVCSNRGSLTALLPGLSKLAIWMREGMDARVCDTVELRQAGAVDAPAIRKLTREAYAKWVPIIGREPKPMIADYAQAVLDHRFDLLYRAGTLVAVIETVPRIDHLLIENLAVSPSFQGRGFGRRLMAHAECLAAASGFGELRLYTNKHFGENIRFYRKLGYRVDREEAYKGGFVVHMSKFVR